MTLFHFTASVTDRELAPVVQVAPSHVPDDNEPDDDFTMPATITAWPFGIGGCHITMSVDAAEIFAQSILEGVQEARDLFGSE